MSRRIKELETLFVYATDATRDILLAEYVIRQREAAFQHQNIPQEIQRVIWDIRKFQCSNTLYDQTSVLYLKLYLNRLHTLLLDSVSCQEVHF